MGNDSGDFVKGFFFGALVGAAVALFLAPLSGEEMRDQIREKSIELKERAGTLSEEATRRAEELKAKGQALLEQERARFQEALREGKSAAERRSAELMVELKEQPSEES